MLSKIHQLIIIKKKLIVIIIPAKIRKILKIIIYLIKIKII
jgi:hypothetical protein